LTRVRAAIVVVENQYLLHIPSVCFQRLSIQQAKRMHHVVCGLPGCVIFFFFHILIKGAIFENSY
jgi:hypothetical protein